MTTYLESLAQKQFVPNVVIRLRGAYYAMRQPDSGLTVDSNKVGLISGLNLNPTTIDPFRATTTISSYSFTLLDKNGVVTALLNADRRYFQDDEVEIWIGRVGVDMAFSDYLKLPNTYVAQASFQDSRYTFRTQEAKDRLATGAFNRKAALDGDIVGGTTVIGLQSIPSGWPNSGMALIGDEFIGWSGIDSLTNELTGCTRGELNSVPAAHELGAELTLIEEVEANPITILLQILISGGGGGAYDVLSDGCGIDASLVDTAQFEQVRDELFSNYQMRFRLGGIQKIQDFIANEICFPLGIRLRANNNSKIGLALIDREVFDIDAPILTHDDITKIGNWSVDDTKISNRLRISWAWDDAGEAYRRTSEFIDQDSIDEFGERDWRELRFKGIQEDLDGEDLVEAIALLTLGRFALPRPSIELNTHMSASYLAMGDKADVRSTQIPANNGSLDFAANLEVIEKNVNVQTGDIRFKLAFTSFTGVRQCYLAPSDSFASHIGQTEVTLGAGRGDNWRAGWKCRLYDNGARAWLADAVNEIESVSGDVVTFKNAWATPLVDGQHRITFPDYDDASDQQKRFCFISAGTNEFSDGRPPYQISFG